MTHPTTLIRFGIGAIILGIVLQQLPAWGVDTVVLTLGVCSASGR